MIFAVKNFTITFHQAGQKCIFLQNNNEYFISVCHDEEDHD